MVSPCSLGLASLLSTVACCRPGPAAGSERRFAAPALPPLQEVVVLPSPLGLGLLSPDWRVAASAFISPSPPPQEMVVYLFLLFLLAWVFSSPY